MFATSTKTATFLLTTTPRIGRARPPRPNRLLAPSARRSGAEGARHVRLGVDEPEPRPPRACIGIVRADGLDDRATLVLRRPQDLLEQGGGHAVRVVVG